LRGFALIWDSSPLWTLGQMVLLIVQGLLPLVSLFLIKLIVDVIAASVRGGAAAEGAPRRLILLIVASAIVALAAAAVKTLGTFIAEVQSLRLGDHVLDVLHQKSADVDLEYYETPAYHDTLHQAQAEAPYRPARIVAEVAQTVQSGIGLLAVAGLLVSLHWALAPALLLAALPGVLVKMRHSSHFYAWTRRQTAAQRGSRYMTTLLTTTAYAKELRLFDLGPVLRDRFREVRATLRREKLNLVTRRSLGELGAQTLALFVAFATLALVATRALAGALSVGDVVMYFGVFQRAQEFLTSLLAGIAGLYEDNLFLRDLTTFLELTPRVRDPESPKTFPRPITEGIVLDRVTFGYPGTGRDVLHDISLDIAPGEHVALVGENGSGKTTLVKLLCRLYDPTSGSIRIDGDDLREFSKRDLRREIGVIFQDYARFDVTARENIWFGNVDLPRTSERIELAAKQTGADAVIRRLPSGFDTMLGRQFDEGAELSGGEWQKIALARAFLRDSQLLVLDEPAASLDARAEAAVFEQFDELTRGRTAVLISHRLSTVRMVNRIIVMSEGRIVETGAHDELIAVGGRYAELYELQSRHYR
jgi:ATP-binding cassette subfamily B protein